MDRPHALRSRAIRAALWALPLAFLGYFFVFPVVSIIITGLAPDGTLDVDALGAVFRRPGLAGVAWFTVWQALVSTALTVALGLPVSYVLARYRFRGKQLVRAGLIVPFVLPTVVVGSAFTALLGPSGPLGIDLRRTVWAILIAHVFYNVAVVVRTVSTAWERIDPRLEEAARSLGATPWQTFTRVTWPLLRPAVASAASIVFLFTFTSFGVILILGGFEHATLEVEIWRQATVLIDLPVAAALALLQLMGVTGILMAYSRYQERRTVQLRLLPEAATARPLRTASQRWLVGSILGGVGLLVAAPLVVLVQRSLRVGSGYGLDNYTGLWQSETALFVPPATAIGNSLRFAVAATLIALSIGLLTAALIAYRPTTASRWFDTLVMLPLGTSAVTLGFGLLIALDSPIDLRTSAWLVPIAHAVIAIPFVVRTTLPIMRSVQHRLRDAAAVLGAAPGRVWREIDLPIVARGAAIGAGFAFAVSLGEFGATSFIVRPGSPTMPIAIFRFLSQPGAANFGRAMALSVLLMIGTATAVLVIDRLRVGRIGDF